MREIDERDIVGTAEEPREVVRATRLVQPERRVGVRSVAFRARKTGSRLHEKVAPAERARAALDCRHRLRERRPRVSEMGHDKDNDWKKEPKLYR